MYGMRGPKILADSLTARHEEDTYGNSWQYHPRSDYHSKIACWGILFDLLVCSDLLRAHARLIRRHHPASDQRLLQLPAGQP